MLLVEFVDAAANRTNVRIDGGAIHFPVGVNREWHNKRSDQASRQHHHEGRRDPNPCDHTVVCAKCRRSWNVADSWWFRDRRLHGVYEPTLSLRGRHIGNPRRATLLMATMHSYCLHVLRQRQTPSDSGTSHQAPIR